jgi:hypothetical protein
MIPLGINNKTYTNSKTRYRTNFIKILTIKKAVSHSHETAFFVLYIQNTSKIPPRWVKKHPLKYNNPLPTLNILYSKVQATLTLPPHPPLKYNKPPQKNTPKTLLI